MPKPKLPENGTLLTAALLVLGLVFGASWINVYVQPGSDPWAIVPWFLGAAALIVVVGIAFAIRGQTRGRRPG
jgi:hypothetical protein